METIGKPETLNREPLTPRSVRRETTRSSFAECFELKTYLEVHG